MVVMEHQSLNYTNLRDAALHKEDEATTPALEDVRAKEQDGLRSLHEHGYVYGNVRNATAEESESSVLFVGWFRERSHSARYPWLMNLVNIKFARPGEEHDIRMANMMKVERR